MHSYGRPGGRGVDEGGGTELSAAAVVPDLLTGIPGGDELAHGLGGLGGNGGGRKPYGSGRPRLAVAVRARIRRGPASHWPVCQR